MRSMCVRAGCYETAAYAIETFDGGDIYLCNNCVAEFNEQNTEKVEKYRYIQLLKEFIETPVVYTQPAKEWFKETARALYR